MPASSREFIIACQTNQTSKPYTWLIVAIFVLLFAQAMSDLSLPGYMSDIVNVGIARTASTTRCPLLSVQRDGKGSLFHDGCSENAGAQRLHPAGPAIALGFGLRQVCKKISPASDGGCVQAKHKRQDPDFSIGHHFQYVHPGGGNHRNSGIPAIPVHRRSRLALTHSPCSPSLHRNKWMPCQSHCRAAWFHAQDSADTVFDGIHFREYKALGMNVSAIQIAYMISIGM